MFFLSFFSSCFPKPYREERLTRNWRMSSIIVGHSSLSRYGCEDMFHKKILTYFTPQSAILRAVLEPTKAIYESECRGAAVHGLLC